MEEEVARSESKKSEKAAQKIDVKESVRRSLERVESIKNLLLH